MRYDHYRILAGLFVYPHDESQETGQRVNALLRHKYPDAVCLLKPFLHAIDQIALRDLQELFTRSFDVQAITTLDVGYVLFGDDYKRGELLANLSREHREANVALDGELGDHLPNMLKLLAAIADDELREEIAEELIAPAIEKMLGEFDPEKIRKKEKIYRKHHKTLIQFVEVATGDQAPLIFRYPLQVLQHVLRRDFKCDRRPTVHKSSQFLNAVSSEMTLENSNSCPHNA